MLAVLLLASLAWGATAEFTHHHGLQSNAGFTQSLLNSEPNSLGETPAIKFQSSDPGGTKSNSKTGSECLICQLHQNLSATVLNHAPGVGPAETQVLNAPAVVVLQLSTFAANQHGRAPPSNL